MSRFTPLSGYPQVLAEGDNRVPWAMQPQGVTEVNWSHPLAAGLVDCVNFGASLLPYDASHHKAGTITGAVTRGATRWGTGLVSGSGIYPGVADSGNIVAGDFTLRHLFVPTSWGGSYNTLIGKNYDGNLTGEIGVLFNASGNINWIVIGNNGGGLTINTGFQVGTLCDLTMVRILDGGFNYLYVYANGVYVGATSKDGTTGSAGSPILFGHATAGCTDFVGASLVWQSWRRSLSAAEILDNYRNPWQLFSAD